MRNLFIACCAVAVSISVPASAHDYVIGDLSIAHPFARATPPGAKVGGGYLAVTNRGPAADRLVRVTSDVSPRVQFHEMAMNGGVMTMRPLEAGLPIPPGATVELKPGGFHVMFQDLRKPLLKGERIAATLVFEKAGSVDVEFSVEALGSSVSAPDTGHSQGHSPSHAH